MHVLSKLPQFFGYLYVTIQQAKPKQNKFKPASQQHKLGGDLQDTMNISNAQLNHLNTEEDSVVLKKDKKFLSKFNAE